MRAYVCVWSRSHGPTRDQEALRPFEDKLRDAASRLLRKQPSLAGNRAARDRLVDKSGRLVLPPGGLQSISHHHFAIVRGGAWKAGDAHW